MGGSPGALLSEGLPQHGGLCLSWAGCCSGPGPCVPSGLPLASLPADLPLTSRCAAPSSIFEEQVQQRLPAGDEAEEPGPAGGSAHLRGPEDFPPGCSAGEVTWALFCFVLVFALFFCDGKI